jgi:hypothetical protein
VEVAEVEVEGAEGDIVVVVVEEAEVVVGEILEDRG